MAEANQGWTGRTGRKEEFPKGMRNFGGDRYVLYLGYGGGFMCAYTPIKNFQIVQLKMCSFCLSTMLQVYFEYILCQL